MSALKVECYSGYRADERPVRFFLQDRALEVKDIEDQWYGPSAHYFRVRAGDDNMYILCRDEATGEWSLSAFRRTGSMPRKTE